MAQKTLAAKLLNLRRFSLRTGLIAFILIGVGMGVLGRWVQDVRRRGAAQRRVIGECGTTTAAMNWGSLLPSSPTFLKEPETNIHWLTSQIRHWVDAEYDQRCSTLVINERFLKSASLREDLASLFPVKLVNVEGIVTPQQLAVIFKIPGLKQIHLTCVIDGDWEATDCSAARKARNLELIDFEDNVLPDNLASELSQLPRLKIVRNALCSIDGLESLSKVPSLTELDLSAGATAQFQDNSPSNSDEEAAKQRLHAQAVKAFSQLAQRKSLNVLSLRMPLYLGPEDLKSFCESSPIVELTLTEAHLKPGCRKEIRKLKNLKASMLKENGISY